MLEIKNPVTKVTNDFDGLFSQLDSDKKRMSEPVDM